MVNHTLQFISSWNGGKNYDKWDEWQTCHVKVVRIWWNRVKSWKLGDYVFAPLIQLLQTVKIIIINKNKMLYNQRTNYLFCFLYSLF